MTCVQYAVNDIRTQPPLRKVTPMTDNLQLNPVPDSQGFMLFEHWETSGTEPTLLSIASIPSDMMLQPGDVIVMRTWAPASAPTIYDSARQEADHA